MSNVLSFEVEFKITNRVPDYGKSEANCYYWVITQEFDF
jgi:hypothetical protein